MEPPKPFQREDYKIGVICALAIEQAAVLATLDGDEHPGFKPMVGDDNQYSFGRIGGHNVVIACLPAGSPGTVNACNVATNMRRSFEINFGLLVGIGGGVWSEENDVHLGDVVVSQPKGQFGGVVQYDFGKTEAEGIFKRTSDLNKPPKVLLNSLQSLQTNHERRGTKITDILESMLEKEPYMVERYSYPGVLHDQLFDSLEDHKSGPTDCKRCDPSRVPEEWEARKTSDPQIHYGNIASANQVMRHGRTRNKIAKELGILCFEMEAAGLMDTFPCLVIRGISDFADTHKNKRWQPYAAATAAAFAKELLGFIPRQEVVQMQPACQNKHWIIPRGSSTLFTGRVSVIKQIQQQLCNPDKKFEDQQRRFVLVGMGGIGKSEICLKVAENVRERFWGVFWVDVSSKANAERGFVDVGQTCEIPEPTFNGVKKWLAAIKHSWLLVLDNADDRSPDYAEYFPSGNRGCIVLTTRNPQCHVHNNVGWTTMESLDRSDAIALLLKTICGKQDSWSTHQSAAEKVVTILGSHTLAIVQAGAFILQGLCSLEQYPDHFKRQRQRLLSFRHDQAASVYGDVYATFEVSALHLEKSADHSGSAKIALALLRFLAFVHFDSVPISSILDRAWESGKAILSKDLPEHTDDLVNLNTWHVWRLHALLQNLPDDKTKSRGRLHPLSANSDQSRPTKRQRLRQCFVDDELDTILLNQACADLASFSIVSIDEITRTLTMHPLAHAWASDRLEASDRDEARVSAGCILALSQKSSHDYDLFWLQLQSHVESYIRALPLESLVFQFEVFQCLSCLARLLLSTRSLTEAERVLSFLVGHESVSARPRADITVSCDLASCYISLGKFNESETLLEKKFQIYKAMFGPAHTGIFFLQKQLGHVYGRRGKTAEAIQLFEHILQYYEPGSLKRLSVQHELGFLYITAGEGDKGIRLLREVVLKRASTLEPKHMNQLLSQSQLARAYVTVGEAGKAIPILETVVQIQKRIFRAENMNRLVSERRLGAAYVNVGEAKKGVQLLEAVLQAENTASQTDEQQRSCSLYELANAYLGTGQVDKAIELLTDVVRTRKMELIPEDSLWRWSEDLLAKALSQRGIGQHGTPPGTRAISQPPSV